MKRKESIEEPFDGGKSRLSNVFTFMEVSCVNRAVKSKNSHRYRFQITVCTS